MYKSFRSDHYAQLIEETEAKVDEFDALMTAKRQELYAHELSVYKGWPRFFLVTGGHIHSSRDCHTLRVDTQVGWLPDLSGLNEEEAVKTHGPILCTHCYPTAPVEWKMRKEGEADAALDDGFCLNKQWDREKPHRRGYVTGNWGVCTECGAEATMLPSGLLRKHKRGEN